MKRGLLLLALLFVACAHQKPDVSISVIHMGAVYPPLPEGCPIDFVNAQHFDVLTSGQFDQIGMISLAGAASELDRAISAIPDAVAAAACRLGGDAVSIANMMRSSSDAGVLQFSIWHSRAPKGEKPAKPAGNAI